jgi:hypothetical protein
MKLIFIKQNGLKKELDPDTVERASYRGDGELAQRLIHFKRGGGSLPLVGEEARRVRALLGEFISRLREAQASGP